MEKTTLQTKKTLMSILENMESTLRNSIAEFILKENFIFIFSVISLMGCSQIPNKPNLNRKISENGIVNLDSSLTARRISSVSYILTTNTPVPQEVNVNIEGLNYMDSIHINKCKLIYLIVYKDTLVSRIANLLL